MLLVQLLLCFAIIKVLLNLYRLLATYFYYNAFKNKNERLDQYSAAVGRLFVYVGTQRRVIVTKRNYMKEICAENISEHLSDTEVHKELCKTFQQTIGVYKYRIRQAFYPSYWITWPLSILALFNIEFGKIGSVITGIIIWAATFVAEHYLEEYLDLHSLSDVLPMLDNLLK